MHCSETGPKLQKPNSPGACSPLGADLRPRDGFVGPRWAGARDTKFVLARRPLCRSTMASHRSSGGAQSLRRWLRPRIGCSGLGSVWAAMCAPTDCWPSPSGLATTLLPAERHDQPSGAQITRLRQVTEKSGMTSGWGCGAALSRKIYAALPAYA